MKNITFEKNYIISSVQNAARENKKIYIYGSGQMGKIVSRKLKKENIDYEAFVVDDLYFIEGKIDGKPILSIGKAIFNKKIEERPVVIVAFRVRDYGKISKLKEYADVINEDVLSLWFLDESEDTWNSDYLFQNREKLLKIYNMLEDNISRESLKAFLYQKMSGKFTYLKDVWKPNQYYDKTIVDFRRIKSFVDCGAYDGDSFFSFINNYEKSTHEKYDGEAYLLEPDELNYYKMRNNCKDHKNICFLNVGAWNEKGIVCFTSDETLSGVHDNGNIALNVDTIDNITKEKADFIKMDIEGAELKALWGAEKTIKKCHPILAICVYHRCSDLWKIPDYIKSIDEQYKFYIRAHSNYSMELVLYAI